MVGRPMRFRNFIVGAILSASMLVAAPAYAQNAAQGGYSSPQGSVQEQITTRNDPPRKSTVTVAQEESSDNGGNLPFTGLDVMLIVAAGGVLLAMGVGIRRLSRSELA
jgi:hypothetical protein